MMSFNCMSRWAVGVSTEKGVDHYGSAYIIKIKQLFGQMDGQESFNKASSGNCCVSA